MDQEEKKSISYKALTTTWVILAGLTGLTVYVSTIDLGQLSMLGNILLASLKAGLVLYVFMHMKFESRLLKAMLLMVLVTLTSIFILTFFDVLYR